jgi:HPt (histidine-containing phosphotransfer) domain-containing protein
MAELIRVNEDACSQPIVVRAEPDLADLVPQYLERRRAELPALHAALLVADVGALQKAGHRLKGSAAGYGCAALGALGAELDAAARAGDLNAAERAVAAISNWVSRAVPAPAS